MGDVNWIYWSDLVWESDVIGDLGFGDRDLRGHGNLFPTKGSCSSGYTQFLEFSLGLWPDGQKEKTAIGYRRPGPFHHTVDEERCLGSCTDILYLCVFPLTKPNSVRKVFKLSVVYQTWNSSIMSTQSLVISDKCNIVAAWGEWSF